ncbi:hypothetical protein PB01_17435 [Psychrobacillus glaciei]|uniref:Uncharacterized protein n=1 Tax=Psychrobacillus glaciei TaxID=2283160 RepID=A0A5J6SR71_9BACI|nr:hypothetical protein [Psychrobacillus glaciei]QFG00441.1 hypothetical protein PB01_17435 [Psychrobacillus glaciei]
MLTATTLSEEGLSIQYDFLEMYLNMLTEQPDYGIIFKDERTYTIETPKYIVRVAILDSSDYCFYTINKKTEQLGNYSRALGYNAFCNKLEKFI